MNATIIPLPADRIACPDATALSRASFLTRVREFAALERLPGSFAVEPFLRGRADLTGDEAVERTAAEQRDRQHMLDTIDAGGPNSWAGSLLFGAQRHRFPEAFRSRVFERVTQGLELGAVKTLTGPHRLEPAAVTLWLWSLRQGAPGTSEPKRVILSLRWRWDVHAILHAVPLGAEPALVRNTGCLEFDVGPLDRPQGLTVARWLAFLDAAAPEISRWLKAR